MAISRSVNLGLNIFFLVLSNSKRLPIFKALHFIASFKWLSQKCDCRCSFFLYSTHWCNFLVSKDKFDIFKLEMATVFQNTCPRHAKLRIRISRSQILGKYYLFSFPVHDPDRYIHEMLSKKNLFLSFKIKYFIHIKKQT